jgi:hypothetical protein
MSKGVKDETKLGHATTVFYNKKKFYIKDQYGHKPEPIELYDLIGSVYVSLYFYFPQSAYDDFMKQKPATIDNNITVFIEIGGRLMPVNVKSFDTVTAIKQQIQLLTELPVDMQILKYDGLIINDDNRTLSSYNITHRKILVLYSADRVKIKIGGTRRARRKRKRRTRKGRSRR